jgi:predicted DNA-binding protein
MPVIQIYIREELYKELIKLCEQLGVNEKDFIREALEKWLEARKNVRPGEEKA